MVQDIRDIEFDIVKNLFTNLVDDSGPEVKYSNNTYSLLSSYRWGFHYHDVYRSCETKELAMHVWDGDMSSGWDGTCPPSCGVHESISDMLKAVSLMYWKAQERVLLDNTLHKSLLL